MIKHIVMWRLQDEAGGANNVENLESGILSYYGVHLSDTGNRQVAGQVLKALGARYIN